MLSLLSLLSLASFRSFQTKKKSNTQAFKDAKALGYGKNKQEMMDDIIASNKLMGFKHPKFKETIKTFMSKELEKAENLYCWSEICPTFSLEMAATMRCPLVRTWTRRKTATMMMVQQVNERTQT